MHCSPTRYCHKSHLSCHRWSDHSITTNRKVQLLIMPPSVSSGTHLPTLRAKHLLLHSVLTALLHELPWTQNSIRITKCGLSINWLLRGWQFRLVCSAVLDGSTEHVTWLEFESHVFWNVQIWLRRMQFNLLFALTLEMLMLSCTVCDMQQEQQIALTKTSKLVRCGISSQVSADGISSFHMKTGNWNMQMSRSGKFWPCGTWRDATPLIYTIVRNVRLH